MNRARLISRGRGSGGLLMLLGAWGAVIPFVGPYFGYAFTPDKAWTYTSGRLWLSIVPGAAVFLGGLLVVASEKMAVFGAFLAALGGVWFVLGQSIIAVAFSGDKIFVGSPVVSSGSTPGPTVMKFLEGLGFFYGLGVVIVFYAALAMGRAASARRAEARAYRDGQAESAPTEDLFHSTY
jgi:hypothetical protein